ncbi:MAG: 2-hydroxychromene-2-carboxylate isomerase [Burkholderiales bacterium]|nr:2-hydroxychromene-2-carboxylate isomerase [Burkholderiales bacterium]
MIEFFFDISSPWTYLAFHNLQPMVAALNEPVSYRPVLVGGIFNAVNPSVYAFRENGPQSKQAYVAKDLADWARDAGLKILWPPSVFPVNSVKALRACILLAPQGRLVDFARAAFEAYWRDDQDISQDAVIAAICQRLGLDAVALLQGIASPEVKAQLKANTDEVIARGGFGSPTIFVSSCR